VPKREEKREEKGERAFRDDAPIAIQADELEAVESQGARKLAFTGNVRASQDDMRLRSNRLDAFYRPGESQPERLVATGEVEIDRGGRQAFCDTATYFRDGQKIVCVGNDAVLQQESDRVRGKTIIFYLDRDVLEVEGGADVLIHPKSGEKKPGGTT
jgi:lipopolysaccharide transport protein LptA